LNQILAKRITDDLQNFKEGKSHVVGNNKAKMCFLIHGGRLRRKAPRVKISEGLRIAKLDGSRFRDGKNQVRGFLNIGILIVLDDLQFPGPFLSLHPLSPDHRGS
jgi:hypothetical protein